MKFNKQHPCCVVFKVRLTRREVSHATLLTIAEELSAVSSSLLKPNPAESDYTEA